MHQGEGLSDERWADPDHQELTHYHKYKLIADGDVPLPSVAPAPVNPRTNDYPPHLRPVSDLFNALYRSAFFVLDEIFSDDPDKVSRVGRLYGTMSDLMNRVARYLTRQHIAAGLVAAPTFGLYEFASPDVRRELADLAFAAAGSHPEIGELAGTILSA